MNIFSENDRCIARIVVDEISHEFTYGEFSLIAIFANFMKLALQSNGLADFRINTHTAEILENFIAASLSAACQSAKYIVFKENCE